MQRRAAALNLLGPTARVRLDDQPVLVQDIRGRPGAAPSVALGTVLDRTGEVVTVAAADGAVEVAIRVAVSGSSGLTKA